MYIMVMYRSVHKNSCCSKYDTLYMCVLSFITFTVFILLCYVKKKIAKRLNWPITVDQCCCHCW